MSPIDKTKIINKLKSTYRNIRISNIKPTGILATRLFMGVIFLPIILVIVAYIGAFIRGYVSDDISKIIDVGLKIIDHIFIPSVLGSVMGFLALWIDNNGNGIPDKLEEREDKK